MPTVKAAFQPDIIPINVADITPHKTITPADRRTDTYRRIAASMEHVGLIEPLVVFPSENGKYGLLDGHTRLDILINTNVATALCLLATDNEAYTYNKKVNYLPPIAQHHMILRALAHVREEDIASALNVKVASIREKRDLLKGICPETVELLQNQRVSASAFCALRKMKPVRQIDVARLMLSACKFSGRFAKALLNGTSAEFLATQKPQSARVTPSQQSMMEQETDAMLQHVEAIKASYGNDVLKLTASCGYIKRLLANARVHRYLAKKHTDVLVALEQLLVDIAAEKRRAPRAPAPIPLRMNRRVAR